MHILSSHKCNPSYHNPTLQLFPLGGLWTVVIYTWNFQTINVFWFSMLCGRGRKLLPIFWMSKVKKVKISRSISFRSTYTEEFALWSDTLKRIRAYMSPPELNVLYLLVVILMRPSKLPVLSTSVWVGLTLQYGGHEGFHSKLLFGGWYDPFETNLKVLILDI